MYSVSGTFVQSIMVVPIHGSYTFVIAESTVHSSLYTLNFVNNFLEVLVVVTYLHLSLAYKADIYFGLVVLSEN